MCESTNGDGVKDALLSTRQPLKQLNKIAKRPPIDIEFQDLVYSVRDSHNKGGKRDFGFFFLN